MEGHRGASQSIPMGELGAAGGREMKAGSSVSGSGGKQGPILETQGGAGKAVAKCGLCASEKTDPIFLNFLQLKVGPGRILKESSHFA